MNRIFINHELSRNRTLWYGVALLVTNGVFFGATNPSNLSSPVLFFGFGLIVLTLFAAVRAIRAFIEKRVGYGGAHGHAEGFIVGVLALSLALSSLGQLSSRDFVLLSIAAVALYWYVSYQKRIPARDV